MTVPTAEQIAAVYEVAIKAKNDQTPRTVQSHEGHLGPSDIGYCRAKAVLMVKGVERTDSRSAWAANVGTAVHEWVHDALRTAFPTWIVDTHRVTATLPHTGAQISGTFDVLVPEWNAVLDNKTVDGYEKIKRFGVSQNHRFQRHLYALGALEAGLLDPERPILVGNVYLDRSGQEKVPYVDLEEFDPLLTSDIDAWVEDVIYAAQHGEEGSRDVAAPVCEVFCEFFTVCRGGLPVDQNDVIAGPEVDEAVMLYVEGRDLESQAKKMKDQAKAVLSGLNGIAAGYQVRSTVVPESTIESYTRAASVRLDVRKVRNG
ncbi:MAG: hypothetical protein AB7L91_16170 [Dehalococcoidia bacterium]